MISIFDRWRIARELDRSGRAAVPSQARVASDEAASDLDRHRASIARVDELLRAGASHIRDGARPSMADRVLARIDEHDRSSATRARHARTPLLGRRARVAALAAGVLVALAASVWLLRTPRTDPPPSVVAGPARGGWDASELFELSRSLSSGLRARVDDPLIAEVHHLGADATRAAQFLADRVSRPWSELGR